MKFNRFNEAVITAKAMAYYVTHPWKNPAEVGDKFNVGESYEFTGKGSYRQARRFAKKHGGFVTRGDGGFVPSGWWAHVPRGTGGPK